MSAPTMPVTRFRDTGRRSFDDFIDLATLFHSDPTPGLILDGDTVGEAKGRLPEAIRMPTPWAIGNGWIRIKNFGLHAMSLLDKRKKGDIGGCPVRGEAHPEVQGPACPSREGESPHSPSSPCARPGGAS